MATSALISKVLAAVDSISKKYPLMAFMVKLSLGLLLCVVVVNLLNFSIPSQAKFTQVTSPPNELPALFPDNSSIVDLRDGNVIRLNEVMKENVATLVFLYARWCTHCKIVAKTLEKVAEKMKGKVAVVAVDCWYLQGMCRRSSLTSTFPVVIGHTAGQQISYLQGLREDELIRFAARLLRPLHRVTSVEQLKLDLEVNEVMFIGNFDFSAAYHPEGFLAYHHASVMALHDEPLNAPPFAVVSDGAVARQLHLPNAPSFVVVSYLGGMKQYQGAVNEEAIYNWTIANRAAQVLVQNLNPTSGRDYQILHKPAILLFLPLNQSAAPLREFHRAARLHWYQVNNAPQPCHSLRHLNYLHCPSTRLPHAMLRCPVLQNGQLQSTPDNDGCSAQQHPFVPYLSEDPFSYLTSEVLKSAPSTATSWFNPTEHFFLNPLTPCFPLNLSYFYLDSVRYVSVLHSIGYRAATKQTTALVMVDVESELQFLKDFGNSSVEANVVVDFISDVTLGKVPPLVKSAPPPEDPCLRSGSLNSPCILEVTSETFTQAVLNTNEDVLLVHYAPWCAACSRLWSTLFAVGEAMRPSSHLIIARIDAEANDVLPCHKASMYPTLSFYPAYRKSSRVEVQMNGPYTASNIIRFLQEHSTHRILTVSDVDKVKEDITMADWSHEGWLLWIQAQKRILNLEKKNELLYHKVKELEYQLVNREDPQKGYTTVAKEKLDEAYAQLQYLIMQQFNMLAPGVVPRPPPPPPREGKEGVTSFTEYMSGSTSAAKEPKLEDNPDRKVCRSEESGPQEEGRQVEEGRQFDDGVRDGKVHKSRSPHKRIVMADDAGIVFGVPATKAGEDVEEDPDGSEEEEGEPVHHATTIAADDAGIFIEQHHRDGSTGDSGSMPKAVGDNPTNNAMQFKDTAKPSLDNGNTPLVDSLAGRHEEYPLPLQEALPIEDIQMGQAEHVTPSSALNSNPQDTPGLHTGDDSHSNPDEVDHSHSLNSAQTHKKGDTGNSGNIVL